MSAAELYAAMVDYVRAVGWKREEHGSGWWIHPDFNEATLGDAVEESLRELDNIDLRVDPPL